MNRAVRYSRRSIGGSLLVLLPGVAFAGWLSSDWVLPLNAGIFFAVYGLRAYFDTNPQLIIGNEALHVRKLGTKYIPWGDIVAASAWQGKRGHYLTLHLRNIDVYRAGLFSKHPLEASLMKLFASSELQIPFTWFDASASDIAVAINEILATRAKTLPNKA